jgi:CubicO group peptidase (beta-lactamase class C family)
LDLSTLADILDGLSSGSNTSKWNTSTTSISIEITSANSTFFTHNYAAPVRNESGGAVVDNNTIFRVASVTKVFTVLAVLLENKIKMEDLISKFIPELNDPKWAEVSIGMLTSQISGTQRDGMHRNSLLPHYLRANLDLQLMPSIFWPGQITWTRSVFQHRSLVRFQIVAPGRPGSRPVLAIVNFVS